MKRWVRATEKFLWPGVPWSLLSMPTADEPEQNAVCVASRPIIAGKERA